MVLIFFMNTIAKPHVKRLTEGKYYQALPHFKNKIRSSAIDSEKTMNTEWA